MHELKYVIFQQDIFRMQDNFKVIQRVIEYLDNKLIVLTRPYNSTQSHT